MLRFAQKCSGVREKHNCVFQLASESIVQVYSRIIEKIYSKKISIQYFWTMILCY